MTLLNYEEFFIPVLFDDSLGFVGFGIVSMTSDEINWNLTCPRISYPSFDSVSEYLESWDDSSTWWQMQRKQLEINSMNRFTTDRFSFEVERFTNYMIPQLQPDLLISKVGQQVEVQVNLKVVEPNYKETPQTPDGGLSKIATT